MPRGGVRAGAGRRPKPVETHLRAGTYRADRHGPLAANVLPMPAAPTQPWAPNDADVAVIGPAGREFIAKMLRAYTFTVAEGVLLLEGAQAVAALSAVRAVNRDGRSLREIATLERMEQAWMRVFGGILAQLKVSE